MVAINEMNATQLATFCAGKERLTESSQKKVQARIQVLAAVVRDDIQSLESSIGKADNLRDAVNLHHQTANLVEQGKRLETALATLVATLPAGKSVRQAAFNSVLNVQQGAIKLSHVAMDRIDTLSRAGAPMEPKVSKKARFKAKVGAAKKKVMEKLPGTHARAMKKGRAPTGKTLKDVADRFQRLETLGRMGGKEAPAAMEGAGSEKPMVKKAVKKEVTFDVAEEQRRVRREREIEGSGKEGYGPEIGPMREGESVKERAKASEGMVSPEKQREGVERRRQERKAATADRKEKGVERKRQMDFKKEAAAEKAERATIAESSEAHTAHVVGELVRRGNLGPVLEVFQKSPKTEAGDYTPWEMLGSKLPGATGSDQRTLMRLAAKPLEEISVEELDTIVELIDKGFARAGYPVGEDADGAIRPTGAGWMKSMRELYNAIMYIRNERVEAEE